MHALMAAVLLRVAGFDRLDGDAEAEPPDGKPGKIEEGVGAGEGDAIVGSDGCGQAELPEGALEDREGISFFGGGERPRRR
jgi:hypothetical protein